jgi:acetate CoA/acetoacetate CoA-transferase alpha subunit
MGKVREDKVVSKAVIMQQFKDEQSVMVSGFSTCGIPTTLLELLYERGTKDITLIGCSAGKTNDPVNYVQTLMIHEGRIIKSINSFVSTNPEAGEKWMEGILDMEVVPQGTFVERIRAGGCGLGGVLTPVGIGTIVSENKRIIDIDGKQYLLEKPLIADIALIHAYKADRSGNLMLKYCGRNFVLYMAMAAKTVIVQADYIVENGELSDSEKMVPSIFVDFILQDSVLKMK